MIHSVGWEFFREGWQKAENVTPFTLPPRDGVFGPSDAVLLSMQGIQCLQPVAYLPKLTAAPFALLFALLTLFLTPSYQNYKLSPSDTVIDPVLEPEQGTSTFSLCGLPGQPNHTTRFC